MSAPSGTQRTPETTDAGPALLRAVFRRHAAGVAVITAHGHGRPAGFTATSLASVAAAWPVVAEAEHVGVHVLGEHQRELAATFARPGADRFAPPTRWRRGPHGVPVLEGVLAWMVCGVVARVPTGDHRVVLAEAVAGDSSGAGRPLLYHAGDYNALHEGVVPP
jgi:flavin reductase (DIM6/NTAB) family NADH-FMN oxidoreductase RutF